MNLKKIKKIVTYIIKKIVIESIKFLVSHIGREIIDSL